MRCRLSTLRTKIFSTEKKPSTGEFKAGFALHLWRWRLGFCFMKDAIPAGVDRCEIMAEQQAAVTLDHSVNAGLFEHADIALNIGIE